MTVTCHHTHTTTYGTTMRCPDEPNCRQFPTRQNRCAEDYEHEKYSVTKIFADHEEAMRTDITTLVDITRQLRHQRISAARYVEMRAQADEINRRWRTGPYARHWQDLVDACHDWTVIPEVMTHMLDGLLRHGGIGISEVKLRSLKQARTLTGHNPVRPRSV
ncbi:hypothetical protein ACL02S_23200 [Nocardia sp. 004]|uniref:hypothetical protein n=1 Tax=Nocardia sp. 004 TaxID=3385978 RepID=UPI00399FDAB9